MDNKLVRSSPSIRAVSRFVGHACSAGRGLENGYGVVLSFLESNVSPFFQIVGATVAIFRARVSRAISGHSPFCWRLFRYSDQGSLRPPATAAEMKTDFSRRLQFRFNPRVATGLDRRSTRPARNSYSALVCVTTARPL